MTTITTQFDDLHAATEALEATYKLFSTGLESYTTPSLSFTNAALESQQEAKKAWYIRVIEFFKNIWKRIKNWSESRKKKVKDEDNKERMEKYAEDLRKYKEKGRDAEKEADTILSEEKGKATFKELSVKADAAIKELFNSSSFLEGTNYDTRNPTLFKNICMFNAISSNSSKANSIIENLTTAGQYLDRGMTLYELAGERVINAESTASETILEMVDVLDKLNKLMAEIVNDFESLRDPANAPKSLKELLKCLDQSTFVKKVNGVPFMGKAAQAVTDLISSSEKCIKWFEEVASGAGNPNATSEEIEEEEAVRAIGPSTLNLLTTSPIQFTTAVSRFDSIMIRAIPVGLEECIDYLTKALAKEAFNKVDSAAKTNQEKVFIKEYLGYRAINLVGTH